MHSGAEGFLEGAPLQGTAIGDYGLPTRPCLYLRSVECEQGCASGDRALAVHGVAERHGLAESCRASGYDFDFHDHVADAMGAGVKAR